MRRSFIAYLWDIRDAGYDVQRYTAGLAFDEYWKNDLLQRAVERSFEIIGEAATQMQRHFPQESLAMGDLRGVVAFRNQLAHCYDDIDRSRVWTVIQQNLPELLGRVLGVLAQAEGDARG